jgi:glycosyltransferase involved in cell wall biosynthesis
VETLGIGEYVAFAGEIHDAKNWLSALDIFCFASLDEGLPNVVMEAAVAGVPVVSWRVPFIEEILSDGNQATLVDVEDLVSFKNALQNLICSPELRQKLGNAGRGHVIKNFTLDAYIKRMTEVYDDMLSADQIQRHGYHDYCLP